MLSTWLGGSASCCDVDVAEAGQLDSSGSVSGPTSTQRASRPLHPPPRLRRSNFTRPWKKATDPAGLTGFHFHDLLQTGNTLAGKWHVGHPRLDPATAGVC